MFCKSCGNEIKEKARFCTTCGVELQIIKSSSKIGLFLHNKKLVIGALLLLIASVVLTYSYYSTRPTTNQKNQDIASSVVNIFCEGESILKMNGC